MKREYKTGIFKPEFMPVYKSDISKSIYRGMCGTPVPCPRPGPAC